MNTTQNQHNSSTASKSGWPEIKTNRPTVAGSLQQGLLQFFRWFVPRNQRDNVDIVISELKEDVQDMRKEQKSWAFIQMLVTWHSVRVIGTYALDSASRIIKKLNPIASIFEKKD